LNSNHPIFFDDLNKFKIQKLLTIKISDDNVYTYIYICMCILIEGGGKYASSTCDRCT